MRWLPLHTMQRGVRGVADVKAGLCVPLVCVLAAKVFEATLVFITGLLLSSALAFDEVCFIKSCASAFSFNQSMKSRSVGLTQCFFKVKSDQDSFRLGSNFCTAVLRIEALLRSESYNKTWNCCRIVYDISMLQWRKRAEFVYVCTDYCLWLAKFTFDCLKCVLIHHTTVCELSDGGFSFSSYKSF